MIRVEFRSPEPQRRTLRVSGHAGLDKAGRDIVCAAVSVLVENLGNSLELLTDAKLELNSGQGLYDLSVTSDSGQVELLLASTLLGLRSIAEQFPERVEIDGE